MVRRLKRIKPSTWTKVAIGVAVLVTLSAVIRFTVLHELISVGYLIEWVGRIRSNPIHLAVFYVIFVFAILALPITLFPVIGGVLFPFWIALPLNMLAATAGACLAFGIARFFGREAVEAILKGRLKKFDEAAASHGFRTVLLLRLVGIPPFLVANYALGLSGVSVTHYVTATVIAILPWMALITYAANSLWQAVLAGGQEGLTKALVVALSPVFALSTAVLLSVGVAFLLKRKNARVAVQADDGQSNL